VSDHSERRGGTLRIGFRMQRRADDGGKDAMKVRAKWVQGVSFVGESASGHAVVIDGAPDHGGRNLGMRPMELVLLGAAACTAFDVVEILRKARQPIADCAVDAEAERADGVPKVFTKIHLRYSVAGRGLDPRQVERAVQLSKDKYCSATAMLGRTAAITVEIAIADGDRLPVPTP
jgi:putative redox protein